MGTQEDARIDVWIELRVPTTFGDIDDIVTIGNESWYIPRSYPQISDGSEEDYEAPATTALRISYFLTSMPRFRGERKLENVRVLLSLSAGINETYIEKVSSKLAGSTNALVFSEYAGSSLEPKLAKERRLNREEFVAKDAACKGSHEKLVAAWESEHPFSVGLEEMTVREVRLGLESIREEIDKLTRHLEIAKQIESAARAGLD